MIKRILSLFAMVVLFATLSQAQWTYVGAFPDASVQGSNHALAVDPDGKVWVSDYFNVDSVLDGTGAWAKCRNIRVYNADGTPASFSPIKVISGNGFSDTLFSSTKGMRADPDGNILFTRGWTGASAAARTGGPWIYRINYKTGEGMAKLDIGTVTLLHTSPTSPDVDDMGNVYMRSVLLSEPSLIFDKDFNFVANILDSDPGYARTTVISGDGLTYYDCSYTMPGIMIYHRDSEFDPFVLTDSLMGFKTEAACWDPLQANVLWASAGNKAYSDPGLFGNYQLTDGKWYAIDVTTKALKDSIEWNFYFDRSSNSEKQRSIAFSPDGKICYLGAFGLTEGYPLIEKFTKGAVETVPVTFQVNMGIQETLGKFIPGTDQVVVRGSFQVDAGDAGDWSGTMFNATDPDGDKVYTVTANLPGGKIGTNYEFKYVIVSPGKDDAWEGVDNRKFTLASSAQTLDAVYFNNVSQVGTSVNVTFSVNMEYEIASGRFNPATDTLTVRGSFNGWGSSDMMTATVVNPNFYEFTASYNAAVDEEWGYKFAYTSGSSVVWETGDNYTYKFTQDDITAGTAYIAHQNEAGDERFNARNEMIFQDVKVRFQVNMAGAKDAQNGNTFASITNVAIAGAILPLQWPDGGWPDAQTNKVLFLKDDGTQGDQTAGDNIWTIEITFGKYSSAIIQYKYGANWAADNHGTNDNENAVAQDHFLHLPSYITDAIVSNVFGVMGDCYPDSVSDVEKIDLKPTRYNLAQNFPNPFNPTTSINFSVVETGLVTLKVYNMLGQEVATLLNESVAPGVYNVNFDASNLTSGTYIYKITAGNFTSSKKMMLIK